MINGCTVCHRLDLVIYLQDTATGELIQTSQVEFFCGGNRQSAVCKESGIYAFLNMETVDVTVTVRAAGYQEQSVRVVPEAFSQKEQSLAVPFLWISMIPGTSYPWKNQLHTVSGVLEGVGSICGIACSGGQVRIREFKKKTNTVKLFNPHGRYLYPVDYGIIDQEKKTFELFTVKEQMEAEVIKIAGLFPPDFTVNSPIERVVAGTVKNGNYLLQLRQETESYLIRWTVGDQTCYRELNMRGDAWKSLDGKGGIPWDK